MKEAIIKILGRISTTVSRTLNILKNKTTHLPWGSLKHTKGGIPWDALEKFADAVAADDYSVVDKLIKRYEQALALSYERECYEELYIPAIFALAAPQLSDKRRHEIGVFLIGKLTEAGREDNDLLMEVLAAACGSLGPAILPLVLDAIAKEPDHVGAWYHLWGLTELAAETQDIQIRSQVIEVCVELLEQADRGKIKPIDVIDAAWTLARMNCGQYTALLQRLKKKSVNNFCHGDFVDAILLLQGRLDYTPLPNLWERSVRDWLEPRWQMAKRWYAQEDSGTYGDDEDIVAERVQELTDRFTKSPAAARLTGELLEDAGFIAYHVLEYAWTYVGAEPEELDEDVLDEVLLEIFPRKITADRDLFEKAAPVTKAFLRWLESEKVLCNGADLAQTVHDWGPVIVDKSMNPSYWGPAKSLMMQARADGVDTGDEEALQRYITEYNNRLMKENSPDYSAGGDWTPPIPIVNLSPKIGRNEPCPCGSGAKYKKCCGRITNVRMNK